MICKRRFEFQSTRPLRGATNAVPNLREQTRFQSTRPLRGATASRAHPRPPPGDFNPRAPCGARRRRRPRRATQCHNFNPRAPCGARHGGVLKIFDRCEISIHAPLAGRDPCRPSPPPRPRSISIHAPLAGRDVVVPQDVKDEFSKFQSTRPLRGATLSASLSAPTTMGFQSTRPLRGATCKTRRGCLRVEFQSTRPLRGATRISETPPLTTAYFNPRAPCGARLKSRQMTDCIVVISIHAPLAGRDGELFGILGKLFTFQSTRPLRGATVSGYTKAQVLKFQSTRPLRGATREHGGAVGGGQYFNPRAPCGARRACSWSWPRYANFNPRAPCGARRGGSSAQPRHLLISIHAPLAGRDRRYPRDSCSISISIHAPLAGRDPKPLLGGGS